MSAFERFQKSPNRTERKQQQLDATVLLGGFLLQANSEHNAFWLPELHRKTKSLTHTTLAPITVIESVRRLEANSHVEPAEQPEAALGCWQANIAGGPRRLTREGIQELIAVTFDYTVDVANPIIEGVHQALLARLYQPADSASKI